MLNDYSWNMTGYIPKHQANPHGDGIIPYVAERIFQLEPEPPAVDSLNEYILSALREKNLLYFSFFLHHYEPQLNRRIKSFVGVDGSDLPKHLTFLCNISSVTNPALMTFTLPLYEAPG